MTSDGKEELEDRMMVRAAVEDHEAQFGTQPAIRLLLVLVFEYIFKLEREEKTKFDVKKNLIMAEEVAFYNVGE